VQQTVDEDTTRKLFGKSCKIIGEDRRRKYDANGNVDKRAQSENQPVSQEERCYCSLEQG